jgi:hypothetical protein
MWTEKDIQTGWRFPSTPDPYNQAWDYRNQQYPIDNKVVNQFKYISDEIEEKGYYIIKNLFPKEEIDNLYEQTKKYFLVDDENQHHHKQVKQPLVNSPEIIPWVFNDYSIQIAMSYLKCYPALGTCNFRKSFVNNLDESGVLMFHVDPNSPRFLKFFIYLNDVDENGGPFCIVEGSHKATHHNRFEHHRWPKEEIEKYYPPEKIKYLTAEKGDMIVANTACFHRGVKCKTNKRTMLTINYGIHPEDWVGNGWKTPGFQIKQDSVNSMPDYKKPLTDFLIKV